MEEKIQDKTISPTRRIARNTLMLYLRQILIMAVSLYTVRVVLATLGAEDYGIYNVVTGVVVLFSFVNNAMATATQRFLIFNIGKEDAEKTQEVFSASLIIHIGIAIIFVVLAETVGLWFVSNKLKIPIERYHAALWCYQCSIITTVFNIFRVTYNAVIIAYEKMSFFAWISIVEAILKLFVVYLLLISSWDKLIVYVILLTFVSMIILICYEAYCKKKIKIAHYKKIIDISLVKKILSFSGWSLFGATANVANQQGTNIVINMFTNVTVNAAMGIANQVNSAVYSFVSNFQTSFNPQLVKSYARGELLQFETMIIRSAKFSFYLLSLIVVPLLINCEYVLSLWLEIVPKYTVNFIRFILFLSLIDSVNGPLWMATQATGHIRKYQIIVSILLIVNLPFSIVVLRFRASAEYILVVRIVIAIIITIWRVSFLRGKINFSMKKFFFDVICRCLCVFIIVFLFSLYISSRLVGFWGLVFSCLGSVFVNLSIIYLIGMTREEKVRVRDYINKRIIR